MSFSSTLSDVCNFLDEVSTSPLQHQDVIEKEKQNKLLLCGGDILVPLQMHIQITVCKELAEGNT